MNRNNGVYVFEKHVGETPLQALERMRKEHAIPRNVPLAYAGRLDPMANGKLLVLVGDTCKRVATYCHLDKEYRVSVVLGIASDSHDVLGRLQYRDTPPQRYKQSEIANMLASYVGSYDWPYPALSSKPVAGKPLLQWFLEGRIDDIEIPRTTGTIYRIALASVADISVADLRERTLDKIHALASVTEESRRLGRDFRRHEIIDSWNTWYQTNAQPLQVVTFTCVASAGTYMRTLADEIGKHLGTGALALEIERTEIGKYMALGSVGFWWKKYGSVE